MFVQQVDIVAFKSIRQLTFRPKNSNLANNIGCNGNISGDSLDAIRFVLDPDYDGQIDFQNAASIADLRPRSFVRLQIAFAEDGPIPAILINANPAAGRQLTVTRYLHLCNPIVIGSRCADDQRISLRTFHLRLYAAGQPRALIASPHQFTLIAANAQADDSTTVRITIDAYRQCRVQLRSTANQLATAERLALQRRALQCLLDRAASVRWRQSIDECERSLAGASLPEMSAALQLSRQAANCQQLQCNAFQAGRHQQEAILLASCAQIAELLASVRSVPEQSDTAVQVKCAQLQLQRVAAEAELMRADAEQSGQHEQLTWLQATHIGRRHSVAAARRSVVQLATGSQQLLLRMQSQVPLFAQNAQQFAIGLAAAKLAVAEAAAALRAQSSSVQLLGRRLASVATVNRRLVAELHARGLQWPRSSQVAGCDLWLPQMRAVFAAEQLIGCDELQRLLAADSRLAAQFVGYVLDFVVWRPEYRGLGAKVQWALRHELLAVVFGRREALVECQQRVRHGLVRGWSLDEEVAPLPAMGVAASVGMVRPLREFLLADQLARCPVAAAVVDEWLLLLADEEETYGGAEQVARIFRRSVCVASSGRSAVYGGGAPLWEEWPVVVEEVEQERGEQEPELSVFDLWRPPANRQAQNEERHRLEGLLRSGCEKLRDMVGEYDREMVRLQELRSHQWSLELDLNHHEHNSFRFERQFGRLQQLIASEQIRLDSHRIALARIDSNSPPSSAEETANLVADIARLKPAVLQASAQQATLVRQISGRFEAISNCLLVAVRPTEPNERPQWLAPIDASLAAIRTLITADWQRLFDDPQTVGGAHSVAQLAATNTEIHSLRDRIARHNLSKQLTNQLLKLRSQEQSLSSSEHELLASFADWTLPAMAERLRELQQTVAPDEQLARGRRRLDWFRRRLTEVLQLTRNAAVSRQAMRDVAAAGGRQQLNAVVRRMGELLPLVDAAAAGSGRLRVELVSVSAAEAEAETGGQPIMRLVLRDADRLVHLGARKMRVLQLVWQLARSAGPGRNILWLGAELMRQCSASETVQIMHLLQTMGNDGWLGGVQWFCACEADALRRFGVV